MFPRLASVAFVILLVFALSGQVGEASWQDKLDPELKAIVLDSSALTLAQDEIDVIIKSKDPSSLQGFEHQNLKNAPSWSVAEIPANQVAAIAKNPNVESIQLSKPVKIMLQESRSLISADSAITQQIGGTAITGRNIGVCVIDTGINYSHSDLGGGLGFSFKVKGGYDFVNNDLDPMDDNGHGTHVAGIVAANGSITGVAPNASLVALKVLDSVGSGSFADVDRALDWCISNSSLFNISVITMSLGTASPFLYSSACDSDFASTAALVNSAIAKNITIVAASGNDGSTTTISSPACISNVTPVAATYDYGSSVDGITSFSNRNSLVPFLAPGSWINSTSLAGGHVEKQGTSMSTPHVAGAFALYVHKYQLVFGSTPTASRVISTFKDTGVKINDTGGSNLNYTKINISAALANVTSLSSVTIERPPNNSMIPANSVLSIYAGEGEYAANVSFYFTTNSSSSVLACSNITGGSGLSCIWDASGVNETLNLTANVSAENGTIISAFAFNITVDSIFPKYSNNGTNESGTYVGDPILFFSEWNDTNLDYAILNLRENGTEKNITYKFNNTNWSNFTWSNNTLRAGSVVNWSIWANDTAGNLNSSMPSSSFILWGKTNLSEHSNTSPYVNQNVSLKCKVVDAFANPVSGYPVSFLVENTTSTQPTQSDGYAVKNHIFNSTGNFSISCSMESNSTLYYNVTNQNSTSWNLTVTEAPPSPSPAPPSGGGGSSGGSGTSGGGEGFGGSSTTQQIQPSQSTQQNSTSQAKLTIDLELPEKSLSTSEESSVPTGRFSQAVVSSISKNSVLVSVMSIAVISFAFYFIRRLPVKQK